MEVKFKIEGLSCGHCVSAVERILNDANGVTSSVVSLPDNAIISFDETKISIEDLKKIINDSEIYKVI